MKSYIQYLNNISLHELSSKCFLIFVLLYATKLNAWFLFPLVVALLGLAIVTKDFFNNPKFWGLLLILFLPNLMYGYYIVGNHYFVMIYICLLFIISSYFNDYQVDILQQNAKWLLFLAMTFAVIQKLISREFMSGEFIGHMLYTGQLFKLPLFFNSEIQDIFVQNTEHINTLNAINVSTSLRPPFKFLKEFAIFFTYLTIVVEIIFAVLLLSKYKTLKNWFFVAFVSILILTRQETGFISMVCILLMMQLGKENYFFKAMYLLLFLVSISLIIVKWGYF